MIDLRSDLCSVPTEEMWEAMRRAEPGWATVGEDASVNELCGRVAELLGKAAAAWVPTCGMANLAALLTFCQPGDHVVLESASHVLTSEAMGITELARLHPAPVWAEDGRMDPVEVEELVASRQAILLVLENTHTRAGGTTLSPAQTEALAEAAKRHGCRVHIDGARLVNAAAALGVPLADLAAPANSVVLSLNKSLSAPFGAVLAGSDAVVGRAQEMLHRLGGSSFHRAGIAAAAGLVALDTMLDRVADDHRRARSLAAGLSEIPGVTLRPEVVETNIVLADVSATGIAPVELVQLLAEAELRVLERDTTRIRLVTHRLIGDAEVERAVATVGDVVARHAAPVVVPELDYDWEAELEAYVEDGETQEKG